MYSQKIQKVTGGLTRLASRTKVKKEESLKVRAPMSDTELETCTLTHVALVKELTELQNKTHCQSQQHMQQYVSEEWLQTETELTRERGLWGPMEPNRSVSSNIASSICTQLLINTQYHTFKTTIAHLMTKYTPLNRSKIISSRAFN